MATSVLGASSCRDVDTCLLYTSHYEQVEFAHKTYTDSIGNIVAPYDYPKMPYEKDGVIYVLCGQGADGDYDGGDSLHLARYRSEAVSYTHLVMVVVHEKLSCRRDFFRRLFKIGNKVGKPLFGAVFVRHAAKTLSLIHI